MKRTYIISGILTALTALVSSCTEEKEVIAPTVQSIELSELKKTMSVGETAQLMATVLPDGVIDKTVTWKIEDENIGTIDSEGNITAMAEGETKIFATVSNVTALCALTVVPVAVESITLNETTKKMSMGETLQLVASVMPENAPYKDVEWTSSDETVATVDDNGLVKTLGIGNVAITATLVTGGKSATCDIVILGDEPLMSRPNMSMEKDAEETLEVVLPVILEGQNVLWSVTPEGIVDVTPDAGNPNFVTVKAVSIGSAKITATIGTSSAVCNVTVNAPKEDIDGSTIIMNLSLYENSEEVAAKIKEVDGKGVTEYKLYGDFGKLGTLLINKNENDRHNPFLGTSVTKIDFTGIDGSTWPDVKVATAQGDVTMKGMPEKAFNNGTSTEFGVLGTLKTIILPESCKVLGRYCFQHLHIESLVAPGAVLLGEQFISYCDMITSLYLTAAEDFILCNKNFGPPANAKNCTLYLNPNKAPIEGNKYFKNNNNLDIEWKSVDTSGALPSE